MNDHLRSNERLTRPPSFGIISARAQALYNTMIRGDDDHWLRVLIGRGLGPRHPISWEPSKSKTIFEYLLSYAITKNQVVRARLLLEHGAPPAPTEGRSFFEQALLHG